MTDSISLREGLERYYARNAGLFGDRDHSAQAQAFFRCHDVAHVVFGCDTSLLGDGIVKIYTLFGTTLGWRGHLAGYSEASAFSLFRQYSVAHVLRNLPRLIVAIPRALIHARRMHRRWPWADHEAYLEWSLSAIRREFNIVVIAGR